MVVLMCSEGSRELEMPNTCLANSDPNKLLGNLSPESLKTLEFAHCCFQAIQCC